MTPTIRSGGCARGARSSGGASFAFISEALVGELVGLAELENGDHVVRFCGRDLGLVDRRGVFRRFAPPRTGLRETTEGAANPKLSTINPVQNVEDQPG